MNTITSLAAGSYTPGAQNIPAAQIPAGYTTLAASFECASTTTSNLIVVAILTSLDGVNWNVAAIMQFRGGAASPQISPAKSIPAGSTQVKGVVTVVYGPVVTQGISIIGQ